MEVSEMNRNIQVFVLGIQNFGGEPETVSTRANGQYDFQNGLHKVSYCELDQKQLQIICS